MASASTSISISSGAIKCLSRERAIARTLDESNLLHDHLLGPVDTFRGASDYKVLIRSIWWSRLVDLRVCSAGCVDTLDRLAALADDEANLGGGNQHVLGLVQAAVVFCPLCRVVATTTTSRSSTHGRVAATTTMGTSTIAIVSTSVMASASTSISISSGAIKCLSRERAITRTLDESNLLHDHLLGPVDTFRGASDYKV